MLHGSEAAVFGIESSDHHPVTHMPLEQGIGALTPDLQALNVHCMTIERQHGKAAADAMRAKLQAAAKPVPPVAPVVHEKSFHERYEENLKKIQEQQHKPKPSPYSGPVGLSHRDPTFDDDGE